MSAPRLRLAALAASALVASTASCSRKANADDCRQILDRYVDMTVDGDPSLKSIPDETRGAAREVKKTEKRTTPEYQRAERQCQTEVTKSQVDCALKAGNANEWEACID